MGTKENRDRPSLHERCADLRGERRGKRQNRAPFDTLLVQAADSTGKHYQANMREKSSATTRNKHRSEEIQLKKRIAVSKVRVEN